MTPEEEVEQTITAAGPDAVARRLRLYAGAILSVGAVLALLTAATVRWVTKEVRAEVTQTRADLRNFIVEARAKADADSVRFERVLDVVELAVVALVEPDGSEEQKSAVAELRKRRRVTSP